MCPCGRCSARRRRSPVTRQTSSALCTYLVVTATLFPRPALQPYSGRTVAHCRYTADVELLAHKIRLRTAFRPALVPRWATLRAQPSSLEDPRWEIHSWKTGKSLNGPRDTFPVLHVRQVPSLGSISPGSLLVPFARSLGRHGLLRRCKCSSVLRIHVPPAQHQVLGLIVATFPDPSKRIAA